MTLNLNVLKDGSVLIDDLTGERFIFSRDPPEGVMIESKELAPKDDVFWRTRVITPGCFPPNGLFLSKTQTRDSIEHAHQRVLSLLRDPHTFLTLVRKGDKLIGLSTLKSFFVMADEEGCLYLPCAHDHMARRYLDDMAGSSRVIHDYFHDIGTDPSYVKVGDVLETVGFTYVVEEDEKGLFLDENNCGLGVYIPDIVEYSPTGRVVLRGYFKTGENLYQR